MSGKSGSKTANDKTKVFREQIAAQFVQCLEEQRLDWKKGWCAGLEAPINAANQTRYKGINRLHLMLAMMINGWSDPRFMTFNQIKSKKYKLQAGSKGLQVEYWFPFHFKSKKALTWAEYAEKLKDKDEAEHVGMLAKYYTVFNASMIQGIPELTTVVTHEINPDELILRISQGMEVEILDDGGDRAFYRPSEDKIHLPRPEYFNSDYDYNATALHELAHSTGAEKRLNRNLTGSFGSESYAYEELIAEITSAFMDCHLTGLQGADAGSIDINNHKAYVQSWIKAIREKPSVLFDAIKSAELAAFYMEKTAGIGVQDKHGKQDKQDSETEV